MSDQKECAKRYLREKLSSGKAPDFEVLGLSNQEIHSVLLDIERENIAEMGELVEKLLERERSKTFCSLF